MLSRLPKDLRCVLAQKRHASALHEAAHVVVGVGCGMPIYTVDIIRKVVNTSSGVMVSSGSAMYIVQHVEAALGARALHARVVFAAGGICAERLMARARNDRGDATAIMDDEARIRWFAQLRHVPTGEYKAFKEKFCTEAQELLLADGGHGWLKLTRELQRTRFIGGDHATAIVTGAMDGALSTRV